MVVEKINALDIPRYSKIFYKVFEINNSFDGNYYKIIDDLEYVVFEYDSIYRVFVFKDDKIDLMGCFILDKLGNIVEIDDASEKYFLQDKEVYLIDYSKRSVCNLGIFRRDSNDFDGYNSLIHYEQCNLLNDDRVILYFRQMYGEEGKRIYSCHLDKPYIISFVGKDKQKSYIVDSYSVDDNLLSYNISAIKEYGIREFLKKGSFALHGTREIFRYSKIVWITPRNLAITLPLAREYSLDNMKKVINDVGFKLEVPDRLVDMYNKDDELFLLFKDMAKCIMSCDDDLKFRVSEGNEKGFKM